MRISNIYYHPQFRKSFLDLPENIQNIAKVKIISFKSNPFNPSLKTHKLHAGLGNLFACSITYEYRLVFSFNEEFIFPHTIGSHDDVY